VIIKLFYYGGIMKVFAIVFTLIIAAMCVVAIMSGDSVTIGLTALLTGSLIGFIGGWNRALQ
jgi:hypothetical protein